MKHSNPDIGLANARSDNGLRSYVMILFKNTELLHLNKKTVDILFECTGLESVMLPLRT